MLIGNQYGCILLYCSVEEGFWDLLYLFLMTFVMVFFIYFSGYGDLKEILKCMLIIFN